MTTTLCVLHLGESVRVGARTKGEQTHPNMTINVYCQFHSKPHRTSNKTALLSIRFYSDDDFVRIYLFSLVVHSFIFAVLLVRLIQDCKWWDLGTDLGSRTSNDGTQNGSFHSAYTFALASSFTCKMCGSRQRAKAISNTPSIDNIFISKCIYMPMPMHSECNCGCEQHGSHELTWANVWYRIESSSLNRIFAAVQHSDEAKSYMQNLVEHPTNSLYIVSHCDYLSLQFDVSITANSKRRAVDTHQTQ